MAEIRNPVSTSLLPAGRIAPAGRVQAAREAQRAFFNAALAGDQVATPPTGAAAAPVVKATPAAPDPRLRPGSIIDIKI